MMSNIDYNTYNNIYKELLYYRVNKYGKIIRVHYISSQMNGRASFKILVPRGIPRLGSR